MNEIITKRTFPYFGEKLPASQYAELTVTYSTIEDNTKIIHRQLTVFTLDRRLVYSKPI